MFSQSNNIIHKLVLTGGPCSGKTTGQSRLSEYFQSKGWKVFRVPESASTLLSGGVSFYDLTSEQVEQFEENLIKTMITMEDGFIELANLWDEPCLIICDRGCMDCCAYSENDMWKRILKKCNWNNVMLRDERYDQVIHLVTSANGAQDYYEKTGIRTEEPEVACKLDHCTSQAWIGHPQYNLIDNSTDLDTKLKRMISCVCSQVGVDFDEDLVLKNEKIRFLLESMPSDNKFAHFQDFEVCYEFLKSDDPSTKRTLRKRGQNGTWIYQLVLYSEESQNEDGSSSEINEIVKTIPFQIYSKLEKEIDSNKKGLLFIERCFIWENINFHLFISNNDFNLPLKLILETETSYPIDVLLCKIPKFLKIKQKLRNFIFDDEF